MRNTLFRDTHARRPTSRVGRPQPVGRGATRDVWLAIAWLGALFLFGGSARADVPMLAALRPAAVGVIGFAFWKMNEPMWASVRRPALWLVAFFALAMLHLLPLPPALWNALPHDPLVIDIGRAVGIEGAWRPLSVSSPDTLNAAMATLPVLALVLTMSLARKSAWAIVPALMAIAMASVILGLLQVSGPDRSPLYFYEYYNAGSPIGFFANRNHQAVFLAATIPLATAFALHREGVMSQGRRLALSGASILAVLLAIAMLGSRAGVLTALIGLGWSGLMWWRLGEAPVVRDRRKLLGWGAALALGVAGLLGYGFAHSTSAERLQQSDLSSELRVEILPTVIELTREYAPLGSGIGTFVQAYEAREPDNLLRPSYVNHAHDDWIEWAQTGGVPLMVLILIGAIIVLRQLPRLFKVRIPSETVLSAHAGVAMLAIFAIASLFDYPLRTPANAGVAALAAVWVERFARLSLKDRE